MKKKLLRTLLVAAMLVVGANAWATDYYSTSTTDGVTTTEMHFNQYIYDAVDRTKTQAFVLSSNSFTTSDNKTVYAVNDIIGNRNLYMFNYIAMAGAYDMRHGSSKAIGAYDTGGDGIYTVSTDMYISIINLHPGDKVTVWHSGSVTFRSTNVSETVAVGDALTSGTEYTISDGSQLDIRHYKKNTNSYIGVIKVVSNYDAVSDPTLTQTAAGTTSTIRITSGKSTSGSTVTTYYTTDGTEPSATNYTGSFTTQTHDVDITSATTIKAISITSGTYGGSSFVVSGDFTAEQATLAAPVATITGFSQSGDYFYPIYTFSSDQSATTGYNNEELTYKYSFNGGEETTGTSYTGTSTSGTLTVTVSADGFQSSSTEVPITGMQYVSTYYMPIYDNGKTIYKEPLGYDTNQSTTINGVGCSFRSLGGVVFNGLTVSNMNHAWASTNSYSHSIYTRGNTTGTVTYNGTFPEGSYIYYENAEGTKHVVSSTKSLSFPKFNGFRDLRVLVPSLSASLYTIASETDLTNNGDFTSNISGWDTKGTITKDSDSSTSGSGFGYNASGWAEMWASNDASSADYAYYNDDCYIAQRYVNVPAGNYYISADLVANGGNKSVYTITVNGNVQETANGDFENWTTKAYRVYVPNDNSTITIKYCPEAGGRAWVGIDNVSCVYYEKNVPMIISSAGWATLYTGDALDFSGIDGLTAYTATCDGSTVTLTEVDDVPANTGVVLKGTANTYVIPAATSSTTAKGDLKGSTTEALVFDANAANDYYVLALNGNSEAQFSKLISGTVAAGKAYLEVDKGNPVRAMNVIFSGENTATGIETVDSENEFNGAMFNLAGQRVGKDYKGIVIRNGKKFLVK